MIRRSRISIGKAHPWLAQIADAAGIGVPEEIAGGAVDGRVAVAAVVADVADVTVAVVVDGMAEEATAVMAGAVTRREGSAADSHGSGFELRLASQLFLFYSSLKEGVLGSRPLGVGLTLVCGVIDNSGNAAPICYQSKNTGSFLMWKKLDNFAAARPDASANEPSDPEAPQEGAESLDDPWLISKSEGPGSQLEEGSQEPAVAKQSELPQEHAGQAPPVTLGAYTEAVNKFTRSASAFIEHLPLLAEARRAYEEATRASAELRRVLDTGDENLRALMSHLEQMANVHLVNVPSGKIGSENRNAESSRLGPVRVGEEVKGVMKRFP